MAQVDHWKYFSLFHGLVNDLVYSKVHLLDKPQNPFSKRKATISLSPPHVHTHILKNVPYSQMKGMVVLAAVMAVYMGSLVPKGILTPLVPNSMTESCSRFNFQILSSAL